MVIGIIGAMDEEVAILKERIENREDITIAGSEFHKGMLQGKEVVLLKSGIGKVNAAIGTTLLLHMFKPTYVINTGSAGGFDTALNVGDIVISTEVRYNDVDVTIFGYEFGQVPRMPAAYEADSFLIQHAEKSINRLDVNVKKGLVLSGDSFMDKPEVVEGIKQRFREPLCSEMEAGAIAQVCYRFEVPFVIIRALSDIAGKESNVSFEQFLEKAAIHSSEAIFDMIKEM